MSFKDTTNVAYNGLQVIYPTRNRAAMAVRAIRALLEQPDCDVQFLVSDNSTDSAEREALDAFVRELRDARVSYIIPPHPLGVSEHWDWAIEQAVANSSKNHFILLTDRILYKQNILRTILERVRVAPDRVLSVPVERIQDDKQPVRFEPYPATGQFVAVPALRLFALIAHALFVPALPFLFNCITPRSVMNSIRAHYGNYVVSMSPDAAFGFRLLRQVDSIDFIDLPPLVFYGHSVSTSRSWMRGYPTPAGATYFAPAKGQLDPSLPAPNWITAYNFVMHEYAIEQQAVGRPTLPPIHRARYFDLLQLELDMMENQTLKQPMQKQLDTFRRAQGVSPTRSQQLRLRLRPLTKWILARNSKRHFQFESGEEVVEFARNLTSPHAANSQYMDLITGRINF